MDDTLGLSDRDKELRKWNGPYRYREYEKMLYRFVPVAGRLTREECVVQTADAEALKRGAGWRATPDDAYALAVTAGEALGTAAAERAYADQRLSPAAQAEAAAVDQATLRHLGEIPEQPRTRSHRKHGAASS